MFGKEKAKGILVVIGQEVENGIEVEIKGYWSHVMLYQTIKALIKGLSKYTGKEVVDICKEIAYDQLVEQL